MNSTGPGINSTGPGINGAGPTIPTIPTATEPFQSDRFQCDCSIDYCSLKESMTEPVAENSTKNNLANAYVDIDGSITNIICKFQINKEYICSKVFIDDGLS